MRDIKAGSVFAAFAAIFVLALAVSAVRADRNPDKFMPGRVRAQSLLETDLDGDYPQDPAALAELNGRFVECLYGGADESLIPGLIRKQRRLFAGALLELNPEEEAVSRAMEQIGRMSGRGLRITGAEAGEPVYDGADACSVTVTEYMTRNMRDTLEYTMIRENGRWKIYGFKRTA
ncbi:MAG: hypothetical protein FWC55_08525 [Firmicutes bacterium]|nr:hypothetical protein [Bacillota bacterium]